MGDIKDKYAISTNFIKSVSCYDKSPSMKFECVHKKGEMHKVFNWRKLRFESKPYEKDEYYEYYDSNVFEGRIVDETEINKNIEYMIIDRTVYVRPYIVINYKDGKRIFRYFDTYDAARKTYDSIKNAMKLIEL